MNLDVMLDGSERIHYQDPTVPIYITRGDLKHMTNMAALCHWHEDVELLLPYNGYLSYNVNGHQLLIAEGNAIFVNTRQMHYGYTTDGTNCEYYCICFKPELLCGHRYLYEKFVMPLLTNKHVPWLLLEKDDPTHRPVLDIIRTIADCESRNMALMGKLYELWQGIYDIAAEEKLPFQRDRNLDTLKQMIGFVHTQYSERITLEGIAAAGGVSRSRCCQIFKKYIGSSPNDYVISFRLEKAEELLRTTDQMITEIAFSCGFNSASYFTEVFTRNKGCPPTQYRQKSVM